LPVARTVALNVARRSTVAVRTAPLWERKSVAQTVMPTATTISTLATTIAVRLLIAYRLDGP
jgi:hypothetical protein